MRWFPHTRRSPIGLSLGSRSIRAVQLDGAGRIVAAAILPRRSPATPVDAAELQRLDAVLARQGFTGRHVVLAAPAQMVVSAVMELPPRRSGAPVEEIARLELERSVRGEPQPMEMAIWDLPTPARARDATHVMAVACRRGDAESLLTLFDPVGLEVVALDVHAAALTRAMHRWLSPGQDIAAAVDLGWSTARVVVWHQQTVVYERTLADLGLGAIAAELTAQVQLPPDVADNLLREMELGGADVAAMGRRSSGAMHDARSIVTARFSTLAQEVARSIDYASHQYPAATGRRLVLTGAGAGIPGLAQLVHHGASLEPAVIGPADLMDHDARLVDRCRSPELTTAAGLAMHPGTH